MKRDILLPIRRFHGKIHERRLLIERQLYYWKYLILPLGKKVYVLGTPTHTNIGDSAIVLAEQHFLENNGFLPKQIKEITVQEFNIYKKIVLHCIRANNKSICCWPGGGNLGDQWISEEQFRRRALEELPHNSMIVFPQTIFYTDTEIGYQEVEKSVRYYNGRTGLTLTAREEKSYEIMRVLYPKTKVLLTPDIVLSATEEAFGVKKQERHGVLLCIRSDAEKSVSDSEWDKIFSYLHSEEIKAKRMDMYSEEQVTKENRAECVRQKMQEFAGAELVITDRLHGMVFAAITGTPCIVFSNYNHKVKGTYDWIRYLPYVQYVENVTMAIDWIPKLLKLKECKFDNIPLLPYFDKLAEVVKEKCQKSV